MPTAAKLAELCQSIELILCDVDGVLTDGTLSFDNQGIETKHFHVRDGLAVKLWQRAGGKLALVTARSSNVVKLRAAELGVDLVRQGSDEKLAACQEIVAQLGLSAGQAAYLGDDLPDLPAVRFAGLGIAVADACGELREAADYVTQTPGGRGALREAVEVILKAQKRWDDLIHNYTNSSS